MLHYFLEVSTLDCQDKSKGLVLFFSVTPESDIQSSKGKRVNNYFLKKKEREGERRVRGEKDFSAAQKTLGPQQGTPAEDPSRALLTPASFPPTSFWSQR